MVRNKKKIAPVDRAIYHYWQAFYLALYSRRLYVDVIKHWRGFGLRYFFLVMMIAVIPLSVNAINDLNKFFDNKLLLPFISLPVVQVVNGEVVFHKPMPYFVRNKAGDVLSIVDTTGKINEINEKYPDLSILITKNKIFLREPMLPSFYKDFSINNKRRAPRIEVQPLEQVEYSVFDGREWIQSSGVMKLKWFLLGSVYPTLVFSLYALFGFLILAISLMGQVYSRLLFKFKLTYKQACRLMMVSSATPICLFLMAIGFNITSNIGYAFVIILPAYFSFAILSIKRHSKQMVLA